MTNVNIKEATRDRWQIEAEHLKRSNAALRGHLKRLKNKL